MKDEDKHTNAQDSTVGMAWLIIYGLTIAITMLRSAGQAFGWLRYTHPEMAAIYLMIFIVALAIAGMSVLIHVSTPPDQEAPPKTTKWLYESSLRIPSSKEFDKALRRLLGR